ncbi:helix-turn-helix domain-containing protein [Halobacterium rubrum]|uniref:helix-turn-helix domain-containing protein n=1 Tax=Halobacterium TaxID=2239 RepID=UPI001F2758FE|nr:MULTISPECIES: helix-turn-helix domain-containing protein [Halobacterium]MDH5018716.1 helix-turn-helix domain-containing protein [Halobacterium rubrum]
MDDDEPTLRTLMLVEEPEFGDILRCVFGLHEHDVETYLALADRDEVAPQPLADELDRNRSNVARSLQRLCEKDVASRRREILDGGGEVYCYEAAPLADVKARMHEELDAWAAYVHDRIDTFEDVPTGTTD